MTLNLFPATQIGELFNIDSLAKIYSKAENLAKKRKTSVDDVFERAKFDPLAYQEALTGVSRDSVERHENLVLDRIEKRNTLSGRLKGIFSIDPISVERLHIPKGITPVSDERYESISEKFLKGNLHNFDDSSDSSGISYSRKFTDFVKKHKRPIGAGIIALLAVGAAGASYYHGISTPFNQHVTQTGLDYSTLSKLTNDFHETVKVVMKDLKVNQDEIKLLNEKSGLILDYTKDKDVSDIKIPDPIQAAEIKDMVNAYTSYYHIDSNDQAKLEATKLLPQHEDTFLKWFGSIDKSKLDYETQVRLDLMYNDIQQQKANGSLDLYDVLTVYKFVEERSQVIADTAHQSLVSDLTKAKDVHDATDLDMKYLDSITIPSAKTEDTANIQTIKALTRDYYDDFPTMKKVSEYETTMNGTKTTMTEAPLTVEDRNLIFADRYTETAVYGAMTTFGGLALTLLTRRLADSRSYTEDSTWGYGSLALVNGFLTHVFYDWGANTGTQADFHTSLILHGIPLYAALLGGIINKANRWNRARSTGCEEIRRSNVREI